jgi:threonine/homoserine/homoserine lactone efflux protein
MILELILKGFIIGICISAPVGPIGVLCIQRTLNRGPYYGLVTGLGATASDLLYALMALFSLSFVVDFIHKNQLLIQLIGSLLVLIFGFFIFRTNPVKQLSRSTDKKDSYLHDFVTSFMVTFSNPLIIFILIALFARFQFILPEMLFHYVLISILSVLLGAFSWWMILTSIINLFRAKFNLRGLWLVNKITGSIIMATAIFGLVFTFLGNDFM